MAYHKEAGHAVVAQLVPGRARPSLEGEWLGGVVGTSDSGTGGRHHALMSYKVWKEKCLEAEGIFSDWVKLVEDPAQQWPYCQAWEFRGWVS